MTDINVILDEESIIDDIESVSFGMDEGNFCSAVNINFNSNRMYSQCNPVTKFGELRIKVAIGDDIYSFLLEERQAKPTMNGLTFSVWGRSQQAYLTHPFAETITDTESTLHPWQTENCTVSTIIAYILDNYLNDYSVTINWNVEDYMVYQSTFSVSNQRPIDVISALAEVISAELKAEIDGSLSVEYYSVEEGTSLASYDDLDDIINLDESINYPNGYNAVTVYGKGAQNSVSSSSSVTSLQLEDITDKVFRVEQQTILKVYGYHSSKLVPTGWSSNGTNTYLGISSEVITETITLTWGSGSRTYANVNGQQTYIDSAYENTPVTSVSISYTAPYYNFLVIPSRQGAATLAFYYSDKSQMITEDITVDYKLSSVLNNASGSAAADRIPIDWDICGSVVVEKSSASEYSSVSPGSTVEILIFGAVRKTPYKGDLQTYGYWPTITNSAGTNAYGISASSGNAIRKSESVTFENGVATLSYPVAVSDSYHRFISIKWEYSTVGSPAVQYQHGSKKLYVGKFYNNDSYKTVTAVVSYYTMYLTMRFEIPSSYTSESLSVNVEFTDVCTTDATLSLTISNIGTSSEFRDVTISVKNFTTQANVSYASVWIDGSFKGVTDSEGLLNVSALQVGSHSIKITADGYQDSDMDSLSNESFVIS